MHNPRVKDQDRPRTETIADDLMMVRVGLENISIWLEETSCREGVLLRSSLGTTLSKLSHDVRSVSLAFSSPGG